MTAPAYLPDDERLSRLLTEALDAGHRLGLADFLILDYLSFCAEESALPDHGQVATATGLTTGEAYPRLLGLETFALVEQEQADGWRLSDKGGALLTETKSVGEIGSRLRPSMLTD